MHIHIMGENMKIIYVNKVYILIIVLLIAFTRFGTCVNKEEKTVAVSSTPVTNKRIVVDAGHRTS